MNLSLYIARRYLFSKKSHQVINIISGVAVAGVALATMAMVCTLSVFNGFTDIVAGQFTAFDSELKITASNGKTFNRNNENIRKIESLPGIQTVTAIIEDKAMIQYGGRQVMATIKGVEENFVQLTEIEHALHGNGSFVLQDSTFSYAVLGAELISNLNCGIYFTTPLEIYAPKRGSRVNITNPAANFKKDYLHSSGLVFVTNQSKYDANYILTSIDFTRKIFAREEGEVSSVELRFKADTDKKQLEKEIKYILGNDYTVENRYEQQKDIFKIMEIEKFISYIFLSFIMLVACFNIIGSLSMLIIDKKKDVETLRALGANDKLITRIFVTEGAMISFAGASLGVILGIIICLAQQHFGLLTFGDAASEFVVSSYPVRLITSDIITVLATVIIVGLFAVALPARTLIKRIL
ncbi:MAG: ABC transporter permease [Bacteroidaceae bacterium]|nr:ABC transporter permease [Bacteroidaceae bacterium]